MRRDPKLYLEDIVAACGRIREYVTGMSFDDFKDDQKTVDAVVRNLEVIGEAARAMPWEIRNMTPDVEWRKISGLRNVLIHEYFGVNLTILWDLVGNKIESLNTSCRRLLASLPDEERA